MGEKSFLGMQESRVLVQRIGRGIGMTYWGKPRGRTTEQARLLKVWNGWGWSMLYIPCLGVTIFSRSSPSPKRKTCHVALGHGIRKQYYARGRRRDVSFRWIFRRKHVSMIPWLVCASQRRGLFPKYHRRLRLGNRNKWTWRIGLEDNRITDFAIRFGWMYGESIGRKSNFSSKILLRQDLACHCMKVIPESGKDTWFWATGTVIRCKIRRLGYISDKRLEELK